MKDICYYINESLSDTQTPIGKKIDNIIFNMNF